MDEFAHYLLQNDISIEEFISDNFTEIIELFETSSVEISIGSKTFLLELSVKETQ